MLENTGKSWKEPTLDVFGDATELTQGVGQGKVAGNCDDLGGDANNPPNGPPGNPYGCGPES